MLVSGRSHPIAGILRKDQKHWVLPAMPAARLGFQRRGGAGTVRGGGIPAAAKAPTAAVRWRDRRSVSRSVLRHVSVRVSLFFPRGVPISWLQ